jgi:hypothetical protein
MINKFNSDVRQLGDVLLVPETNWNRHGMPKGHKTVMIEEVVSTRTFVLGMVHDDGRLMADQLYDAGEAGGFTTHQLRLCLARLVTEGLFDQTGRGRNAVFALSSLGRRQLEPQPEFVQLAFAQDAGRAPWDGHWHLVTFSIDEERRVVRNEFREQLLGLGASLSGATYVCANDWDDLVIGLADELHITDRVTLATATRLRVGGESDPKRITSGRSPRSANSGPSSSAITVAPSTGSPDQRLRRHPTSCRHYWPQPSGSLRRFSPAWSQIRSFHPSCCRDVGPGQLAVACLWKRRTLSIRSGRVPRFRRCSASSTTSCAKRERLLTYRD